MTWSARWPAGAVVPVAVLGVVLWQTGHGPFVAGVRALDLRTLALGSAIAVPTTAASAWRWHIVSHALGTPVGLAPAVASSYASQFLNTTLPAGVVGDVYRGVRHAADGARFVSLRAVVWERSSGQALQAFTVVGVLLLLPAPLHLPTLPLVGGGVVVLLALGLGAARSTVVREDLRRLAAPGVVRTVVVSSLLVQAGCAATVLLAARAVGVTAPVTTLLPLALVMLVAMALPLNLAGWGPREGAAAWCFAAAGLGAGTGVATAVAYGVMVMVASLPGAVVLAVDARASRREVVGDVTHV